MLISIVVASSIALPLGIILGYWRKGAFVIINLFNIGRAIPSLGLILLCIIVFGFNDIPVFTALVAMSIPPILTNAWVGIYHADRQLCDAAKALDMTPLQSLWQLRIATAVVAAYAGLGGLGRFLIDGLGQRDIPQVIAGSLVVSLLAIGCELLFSLLSRRIVPAPVAQIN